MSDFPFKKVFLPAALTTGAVFAALTAPMFVFAAQPVKVQALGADLPGERVQDYAVPYLAVAGVISTGIGLSGVCALGLRRSMKQSSSLEAEREASQLQLDERHVFLQQMLASDTYLTKSGLNFFLDDEVTVLQHTESVSLAEVVPEAAQGSEFLSVAAPEVLAVEPSDMQALQLNDLPGLEAFFLDGGGDDDDGAVLAQSESQEMLAVPTDFLSVVPEEPQLVPLMAAPLAAVAPIAQQQSPVPMVAPAVLAPAQSLAVQRPAPFTVVAATPMEPVVMQAPPKPVTAQAAVVPLTAAQGFLSYSRFSHTAASAPAPWNPVMAAQEQAALAKIQALQTQLQQLVVQIETLQTNLQVESAPSQGWSAAAPQRVSPAELNWNNRQIAS